MATPTATPPATGGICDDFNRAGPGLGPDWEEKSPDFDIAFNELSEVSGIQNHTAQMLWSGTTSTVDQFGRYRVTVPGDNGQGFIFRSTPNNGDAGPHYEVHLRGTAVRWEYVLDDAFVDRPDQCTLSSSLGKTARTFS